MESIRCNKKDAYVNEDSKAEKVLPNFKQYSSKHPLGPPHHFYNSMGKMLKIDGMKAAYRKSTVAWLEKTFDNSHEFAQIKIKEFIVVAEKDAKSVAKDEQLRKRAQAKSDCAVRNSQRSRSMKSYRDFADDSGYTW